MIYMKYLSIKNQKITRESNIINVTNINEANTSARKNLIPVRNV